jgi:hypothetical protein
VDEERVSRGRVVDPGVLGLKGFGLVSERFRFDSGCAAVEVGNSDVARN